MVIIDPGIKVDRGYKTYDNGLEMGVFIRVCILVYNMYACVCMYGCMYVYVTGFEKMCIHSSPSNFVHSKVHKM